METQTSATDVCSKGAEAAGRRYLLRLGRYFEVLFKDQEAFSACRQKLARLAHAIQVAENCGALVGPAIDQRR